MGRENSHAGRILVVDDDPSIIRLVGRALLAGGYDVVGALSGEAALDVMEAPPLPHLVILDVMMPEMSGFDVCRLLRSDPRFENVPIVMLTALDDSENRLKGIELGAEEYLTKPFHPRELVARVRSLMRMHDLHASLEESLFKVRRFNTFVENVTMGLDRESLEYARVERLIIAQVLAGGVPATRTAALALTGLPDRGGAARVRCNAYYMDGPRMALFPEHVEVPRFIHALPRELSVGLRYGDLPPGAAAAVAAALPPAVVAQTGPLRDAAVFMEGSIFLAIFNYESAVTRFDAELLRGLSLHLSLSGRLVGLAAESDEAFRYTVGSLARAAEANDTDTGNHIVRVNAYAGLLAKELKMPARFVEDISFMAQLHDVGKIHVDSAILRKPGPLTPAEWEIMKSHTIEGAVIIGDAPRLAMGRAIALTHHERWDGSGYPAGLKGDEIPIEGRITAVADVYDAVRNRRAYKAAQDHEAAVRAILTGDPRFSRDGFDPRVKEAFGRLEKQFSGLYDSLK